LGAQNKTVTGKSLRYQYYLFEKRSLSRWQTFGLLK